MIRIISPYTYLVFKCELNEYLFFSFVIAKAFIF